MADSIAVGPPTDLSTDTRYFEEDAADDHDGILGFSANDVRSTSTVSPQT
jgi:hypothetical protein